MFNFQPNFMNARSYGLNGLNGLNGSSGPNIPNVNTGGQSKVAPIYTVASLQEVQMAQPNYDGTTSYFYIPGDNIIISKSMDLSGLIKLRYFKEEILEPIPSPTIAKETTADVDINAQIDARIAPIVEELKSLTAKIGIWSSETKTIEEDKAKNVSNGSNASTGNAENGEYKSNTASKSVF